MRKAYISLLVISLSAVSCVPPAKFLRGSWVFSSKGGNRIIRTAQRYLGTPYRYGGSSPRGFDCSGFAMYVYKKNGISIPRSVKKQYLAGKRTSLRRARPGDLIFFHTSRRKRFSHVGIYAGNHRFIHAPRTGKRVSYADMNNRYWRKRYLGIVTFKARKPRRRHRRQF